MANYKLNASKFLEWYFSDDEECIIFCSKRLLRQFDKHGNISIDVQDIWVDHSQIPGHLVGVNCELIDREEVELILNA
jgi:hypothetical protein